MKSNALRKLYIALFLVICLVPAVFMLILGPSDAGANEVLSSAPRLFSSSGELNTDYLSDISDYISDRFAFRQEFISAWSFVNEKIFNTSTDEQVVLGKNGELFYSETLDDYMGLSMTDAELDEACSRLAALQSEIEDSGSRFIFTIAPNKNSLYPGNMPDYINNQHETSNAEKIIPYLEKYGINYVDLYSVLSGGERLYYYTDTHWTAKGAALGADALLTAAGISSDFAARSFAEGGLRPGDLYEMLYPTGRGRENEIVCSPAPSYCAEGSENGGNAITINTTGSGEKSIFCWRDSFGIALYPYLAEGSSWACFCRSTDFAADKCEGYDVVILELVERNLNYLLID